MPGVADVPTIRSLDEWNAFLEEDAATPALLQCGSPICSRCVPFTKRINELKEAYIFRHVYVNTHDAEEDLLEELQVSKLPAYQIVSRIKDTEGVRLEKAQDATLDQLVRSVQSVCSTKFSFGEADF